MNSLAHHFVTMAYNNAWSNYRLLKACGQLSQDDFTAKRVSFFSSLKATLNHILTVDWYYIDALERSVHDRDVNANAVKFFDPEEPFDTCETIRAEQEKADRRLIALCESVGRRNLDLELPVPIVRTTGVKTDSLTRILAHLFQHQIHHRGQAHAMLSGTSVAPPQLDEFFCQSDLKFREPDFQALGFDETAIWKKG
jgi:uncharacterized damage-inducible protein DinB